MAEAAAQEGVEAHGRSLRVSAAEELAHGPTRGHYASDLGDETTSEWHRRQERAVMGDDTFAGDVSAFV